MRQQREQLWLCGSVQVKHDGGKTKEVSLNTEMWLDLWSAFEVEATRNYGHFRLKALMPLNKDHVALTSYEHVMDQFCPFLGIKFWLRVGPWVAEETKRVTEGKKSWNSKEWKAWGHKKAHHLLHSSPECQAWYPVSYQVYFLVTVPELERSIGVS